MSVLRWLRALWRTWFRSRQLDAELDAELQSAADEIAARFRARGATAGEADRLARATLGGVQQVKEHTRDARPGRLVEAAAADVRYACRAVRRAPTFAFAVIATFALAIGANSAIFSVVKQLLLEALPYRDAERLVIVWSDLTAAGYPRAPLAGPELKDLRERTTTFEGLAAIWSNTAALTDGDEAEQLRIGFVTTNFFSVLGVPPVHGRDFTLDDDHPGSAPTMLISWELWQRRFGGDASVIGQTVELNGVATTVLGVMPEDFRLWFPLDANVPPDLQAWRPFSRAILDGSRGQQYLRVIGRLRPGVSAERATAELFGISQQIGREYTIYGAAAPIFSALPLHADSVRDVRATVLAVFVGVSLLLLLAALNIANLFVARASARRDEITLRMALGASRRRLLQQWIIEATLLMLAGAAVGLLVSDLVLGGLLRLRPAGLERVSAALDPAVVLFAVICSLVGGVAVALLPVAALFGRRFPDRDLSRAGGDRLTPRPSEHRLRIALVAVQISIGFTLVVAAGLLARSYAHLSDSPLGFRSDDALTFRVSLPPARYRSPEQINAFHAALQDGLAALPAATAVAAASHLPFDVIPNWSTQYARAEAAEGTPARDADARTVSPGFFAQVGARLIEGREFAITDQAGSQPVAVVDELLARRTWPGESPVGKTIVADPLASGTADTRLVVVGVVGHLRHRHPATVVREQIYFPQRQVLRNPLAFIVRSSDYGATLAGAKKLVASLDPRVPVYDVRPLREVIGRATSVQQFAAVLAAAFSLAACMLALVGTYGVLAYAVIRRTPEFAIRLTVGARPNDVMALVIRDALRVTAVGLSIGIGGGVMVGQLLGSQLYGVGPFDMVTYALALGAALLSVSVAVVGPVRRAVRVSAVEALRTT